MAISWCVDRAIRLFWRHSGYATAKFVSCKWWRTCEHQILWRKAICCKGAENVVCHENVSVPFPAEGKNNMLRYFWVSVCCQFQFIKLLSFILGILAWGQDVYIFLLQHCTLDLIVPMLATTASFLKCLLSVISHVAEDSKRRKMTRMFYTSMIGWLKDSVRFCHIILKDLN